MRRATLLLQASSRTPMTNQPAIEIRSLQMLRALAALLVVVCHSHVALRMNTHNYWVDGDPAFRAANHFFLFNHLDLGVDIFFAISGFIMAMLATWRHGAAG